MTTSTTDAEAIARDLNGATSLVIEQMHEAGMPICMREGETTWRAYHAGFDLSLFAQRITDACCYATLSYLASRREAQEPVAWVMPGDDNARDNGFIDAMAWREGEFTKPLYTAPPAPAGEVERPTPNNRFSPRMLLLDDLHAVCVGGRWDGWKFWKHPDGQWVSLEKLAEEPRAALNGGRGDE